MTERQSSHQEGQGSPPRKREGEQRDRRPGLTQEGFLEGVSSGLGKEEEEGRAYRQRWGDAAMQAPLCTAENILSVLWS